MMPNQSTHPVMQRVRKALGRTLPLTGPPTPPVIADALVRRVRPDADLPAIFEKNATAMKMLVEFTRADDLLPKISSFLRDKGCESAMLSETPLLQKLGARDYLRKAGLAARGWGEMTADETYDVQAGVTEADYAVAETGTLAIRHRPAHGRLLSLVPFVHVAVIEPHIIVADLVDLFDRLAKEGTGSGVTLISGPSKTADIEMITVTGVHGPNVVKTFVVRQ